MDRATELRKFATQARRDSRDYHHMAEEYPKNRAYYLKCAADRSSDAEFYLSQASWADRFTEFEDVLEAAE